MRKIKIYLDTSILSHFQQDDNPMWTTTTLEFWETLKERNDVEIFVSEITMREIGDCVEPKLSNVLSILSQKDYTILEETEETISLANIYRENGFLREKDDNDLRHISIAVENDCNYIVSWNFKHFVNPKTIKAVANISKENGYYQVEIVSPEMMIGGF